MVLEARAHVAALRDERDRSVWYARALDAAEERARHRTARELHDGIAQALTGQRLLLASLRRELGSQAPHKLLDTLDHVTAESQSYVRDLIQDLNPPELDDSRLTVIVAKLSRQFLARYAFRVTFEVNGDDRIDPSDLPLVYRIVRELLFNALKHSQTDAADVKVAASEGEVLIAVVDHGVGFTAEAIGRRGRGSGFGLADLCERVRAVGGDVEIGALLPRGSRVSIRLPPSPFRQLSTVT